MPCQRSLQPILPSEIASSKTTRSRRSAWNAPTSRSESLMVVSQGRLIVTSLACPAVRLPYRELRASRRLTLLEPHTQIFSASRDPRLPKILACYLLPPSRFQLSLMDLQGLENIKLWTTHTLQTRLQARSPSLSTTNPQPWP